jgi:electron transfer flavoprotein-quinone oxidoreductase
MVESVASVGSSAGSSGGSSVGSSVGASAGSSAGSSGSGRSVAPDVDVVVVGAGPAGACAALVCARAGLSTVLLERGPFAGSKNMYGGVVYPRILDQLIPNWWETAPVQRWVTRRSTMVLTDTQALTVDYRTQAWGAPPYNGATAYRPDFDHWLAGYAEAAGAELVCDTTAIGLIREGGRVVGVRTDRPGGDLRARVVIACDGVNSFLAKEAGLAEKPDAAHYTLGVKETLALPKELIDERFAVRGREGVDIEMVGCTSGVNGGGFLYTNLDSLALGVVLKLPKLAAQKLRPEAIIATMKQHPAIAPLVEGADLKEYSAHLIPEAGLSMMPKMTADGMLVAGDAAALCLAAGIWLEGVNFAMASGMYAGEAVVEAVRNGDVTALGLAGYQRRLSDTFVLKDHRRLRRAPELVLSDRMQHLYPAMINGIAERMFRVDNPQPKPTLRTIIKQERKRAGVRRRDLLRDGLDGLRTFG